MFTSMQLSNRLMYVPRHLICLTTVFFQSVFSQFGPVKEVRVVTHKSGKAKVLYLSNYENWDYQFEGVAYVDMETDEDADKAVKSNDVVLLG